MGKPRVMSTKEEQITKESEDCYQATFSLGTNINEAIIMLQDINGREGMHTCVSDQWLLITGYTKEELLGMSFFDIVSPRDREVSIERHHQKMSGKSIPDLFELSIINSSGKEIPVELTSAFTIYKGQSTNVVYVRDITERKWAERELKQYQQNLEKLVEERTEKLEQELKKHRQIEKALKVSEDRYRFLFENVPVAIFEMDVSLVKQYFDELKSQGVTDFREHFNSDTGSFFHCLPYIKVINVNETVLESYEASTKDEFYGAFGESAKDQTSYFKSFRELIINFAEGKTRFSYEEFVPNFKGNWKYHHSRHLPYATA